MGKVVVHHFYDEIYKENFYLFIGQVKAMDKEFPEHAPFDSLGRTFYANRKDWPGVCIWVRNKYDWHILAHEAIHAGNWILRQKGVKVNRYNDEALAYYVQWIVEKSMEVL